MSEQSHRIAHDDASRASNIAYGINRDKPLNFTFDGHEYGGFQGDTLASALLANGVKLMGRSFKYHRPRGVFSNGPEEPNALVELRNGARREPNTRATTIELYDGLVANSQNRWPSLGFDVMAINQWFAPLLVAGFYYKTFKWPASFWEKIYEPMIRRAAGLGRASAQPDPDVYDHGWLHCDVLVVGAGPSGIASALAASSCGARVILCDENHCLGGQLCNEERIINDAPAGDWVGQAARQLQDAGVRILTRTNVFGIYDHGVCGALERLQDHLVQPLAHQPRQVFWHINAKRTIICAGAIERPIVFGDNDRPGIMLASALRAYIHRFRVLPGRDIAVYLNNLDGWRTVECAQKHAQSISAIVPHDRLLQPAHYEWASAHNVTIYHGEIAKVVGNKHGISQLKLRGTDGKMHCLRCDTLGVAGGWNPQVGLTCNHRGKPVWDETMLAFLPADATVDMPILVAGATAGKMDLAACLQSGHEQGRMAAKDCGYSKSAGKSAQAQPEAFAITPLWKARTHGKAFVDLQHDVSDQDIELAAREGFTSVEHAKRYTTMGMATDQGKTSNISGLAILAQATNRTIAQTGTTIYRPPYVPVAIGALAGRNVGREFQPVRHTPSSEWASSIGAQFVEVGIWYRAQWYPRSGETHWLQSVNREALQVRRNVGFCDVSSLGKIDIFGRDAGKFLDLVYTNIFSTLPIGKARYGLMLREDGLVMDDGTTSRLGENYYFMTTTTAQAGPVMQHLEFCRQVLWPKLDVHLASATDQWAQFSIAGPNCREFLQAVLGDDFDLSNEGFPFMAARAIALPNGINGRLYRISFSGELAFEIGLPRRFGNAFAKHMMDVGAHLGVAPYGTEALSVLRIEKGHMTGNELHGTTSAFDIGMGGMLSKKKDYIGRIMTHREELLAPDREVLVGLKAINPHDYLRAGAHVIPRDQLPGPHSDDGYVTSVAYSPTLGYSIGLGFVKHGRDRYGEIVAVHDPLRGKDMLATICHPIFYDPKGELQRG